MLNTKTKNRLSVLLAISTLSIVLVIFIFKTLEDNVLYFYSPSEIDSNNKISFKNDIRIGGMVKKDSVSININEINFIITDFKNEINVIYSGAVPNLFEEGKGVVAEGFLKDRNFFMASKILAKHDENYMPPEVKAALKEK